MFYILAGLSPPLLAQLGVRDLVVSLRRIDPTEADRLLHEAAARGERIAAGADIPGHARARLSERFGVLITHVPRITRLALGATFLMVSLDPAGSRPGPGRGRPYARYCAGRIMSVTAGEDVVGEWLETSVY